MEQKRPLEKTRGRETESIARVPHLLAHLAAQLPALAETGATFEEVRVRYGNVQSELGKLGLARVTTPRAGIRLADRYWSSVRDLIKELQTLGWVEAGVPVPSRGGTVDKHRQSR